MSANPRTGRRRPGPNDNVQLINASVLDAGLPCSLEAERLVLGSILLNDQRLPEVAVLEPDDFHLEKHRRIFECMRDLEALGEPIDRLTVFDQLSRRSLAESCDGISYLVSLDDGMPNIIHLGAWVRIVLEKSRLRSIIFAGHKLTEQALLQTAMCDELIAGHLAAIQELSRRLPSATSTINSLAYVDEMTFDGFRYLVEPILPERALVAFTGLFENGKSSLATALLRDYTADGGEALILDRENPFPVIADRFRRLGISRAAGNSPLVWGSWLATPPPDPDSPEVINWVKSCKRPPAILIDSKSAYGGGADENDAGANRLFAEKCKVLVNLGATVSILHNSGKSEGAKYYRGSSDFPDCVDQAFYVSNHNPDGTRLLHTITLECFKSRFGHSDKIIFRYADGRMERDQDRNAVSKAVSEQLTSLLHEHAGIGKRDFEDLATAARLGRENARKFLDNGHQCREISIQKNNGRGARYYLAKDAPKSGQEPMPD